MQISAQISQKQSHNHILLWQFLYNHHQDFHPEYFEPHIQLLLEKGVKGFSVPKSNKLDPFGRCLSKKARCFFVSTLVGYFYIHCSLVLPIKTFTPLGIGFFIGTSEANNLTRMINEVRNGTVN